MQEYLPKLTVTYGFKIKQKELYIQNIYTCNIQQKSNSLPHLSVHVHCSSYFANLVQVTAENSTLPC